MDDPEARLQAQKALNNKHKKNKGVPMVAEMLAKAVKKDRDAKEQMDDVSQDGQPKESP